MSRLCAFQSPVPFQHQVCVLCIYPVHKHSMCHGCVPSRALSWSAVCTLRCVGLLSPLMNGNTELYAAMSCPVCVHSRARSRSSIRFVCFVSTQSINRQEHSMSHVFVPSRPLSSSAVFTLTTVCLL